MSQTVWNGQYERYYSEQGATYIDKATNLIGTSYSAEEFTESIIKMLEVNKNMGVNEVVKCPLVDDEIEVIDCIENRDVVDQLINEFSMPEKYKKKKDWKEICNKCKYYNY